ncbi:hypothetical protein WUBG_08724 [Wuchereria bancrofti]|uniref:Uncharacterized protein n=1 Tax=Wuchereria bancrofti TaxID=6293 RepID=J9ETC8_WUCBA|nr:hypothetical protein WUBG_08724 [Wuchereria bancrofti]
MSLQKRAHDAGIENIDRVGSKDWWRNIPPPSATRRGIKRGNYDTTNYSFRAEGSNFSGEVEEFDDDGDQSCVSGAASGENGCLELLDVVSESEIYTTDQEPAPSGSFERDSIVPEPPEQISLFSNRSEPGKRVLHQGNHISLSVLPGDRDEKTTDGFLRNSEENNDVQYYLLQDYDDGDDDDDDDDNGDDDDDVGDGDEDRGRNGDDDNDVDVDNVDQVNTDNADDEVMREYNDVLTEVDRLERSSLS